eukprot:162546-Rhodomonas_salina.1
MSTIDTSLRSMESPTPNCPASFRPAENGIPDRFNHKECPYPAATCTTSPTIRPCPRGACWSSTGAYLCSRSPSPSCPLSFPPHTHASPESVTAKQCDQPAAIETTLFPRRAGTSNGSNARLGVAARAPSPSKSCPSCPSMPEPADASTDVSGACRG